MTHKHDMRMVAEIVAPVGAPPGHTKFYLLVCRCGRAQAFPHSNYLLANAAWQAEFIARLQVESCWLDEAAR